MQRREFVAGRYRDRRRRAAAPAIVQAREQWNMVMPWPRNTPGVG